MQLKLAACWGCIKLVGGSHSSRHNRHMPSIVLAPMIKPTAGKDPEAGKTTYFGPMLFFKRQNGGSAVLSYPTSRAAALQGGEKQGGPS